MHCSWWATGFEGVFSKTPQGAVRGPAMGWRSRWGIQLVGSWTRLVHQNIPIPARLGFSANHLSELGEKTYMWEPAARIHWGAPGVGIGAAAIEVCVGRRVPPQTAADHRLGDPFSVSENINIQMAG
eukprot:EG_transcript_23875